MRRLAPAVALVAVLVGLPAAAALAQEVDGTDGVLRVDRTDALGGDWVVSGVSTAGEPDLRSGDETLDATYDSTAGADAVLVIDNDRRLANGVVQLQKQAMAGLAESIIGDGGRVAVVSTATEGARQEIGLSSSLAEVEAAIVGVQQLGDSATWDALARAGELLEDSGGPAHRVVATLSAPDALSLVPPAEATDSLRIAAATLDAVVLPNGVDAVHLDDMVGELGGSLQEVDSDEGFAPAVSTVGSLISGGFALTVAPTSDGPTLLTVAAGELTEAVEVDPGRVLSGAAVAPAPAKSKGIVESVTSAPGAGWLVVALVMLAAVGAVWGLLSLLVPDENSLGRRLRVYEEQEEEPVPEGESPSVTTVPLLKRAVALTGEVAEKRGLLESIEVTLERANLPLRAAEATFFALVIALLAGVLGWALTGNPLMGLAIAGFGLLVPKAVLDFRVRRRQKAFVAQLPDMLSLLAGTLKAGYSITQGFEAVSKEIEDPMGRELRRVVTEHRLGRTLEDALDATAERMDSDDFRWTVMAIKIQREVGGNLAELLLTVADTMTQRERLRRDVNSLTAEGRISALILGLLPPGLGLVMFFMNRPYIEQLFTPGLGYLMLGAAVIAMGIGFAWMKKIITIEV